MIFSQQKYYAQEQLETIKNFVSQPIADAKLVPDTQVANAYCSTLSIQSKNDITDNESLIGISVNYQAMFVARNGSDTDAPTGEFVYELATPTTFYTQPTSIKSLDGENNVSASTGDVDVEYQTLWVRPTE